MAKLTTEQRKNIPESNAKDDGIDDVFKGIESIIDTAPTYRKLFSRWENQQWSTEDTDFSEDARQWNDSELFNEEKRESIIWSTSSFFLGEERVTTELLPFAIAVQSDDARAFLATQISDEAKHVMFFDRLYREVYGTTAKDVSENLKMHRPLMNEKWGELFDDLLHGAAERLREDPSDRKALYEGIIIYHFIVEGTLALTGAHFIMQALKQLDIFPGFRHGFTKVTRDESRHVGFGIRFMADAIKTDPEALTVIEETLAKTLPVATLALVPPWAENPYDYTDPILGVHSSVVFEYAANSLQKKLSAIGYGLGNGKKAEQSVAAA